MPVAAEGNLCYSEIPVYSKSEVLPMKQLQPSDSLTVGLLLALTGGIVQGMSGSPILQNGKIIGAVTHVFVQDSAKGFGIFIENMLNAM